MGKTKNPGGRPSKQAKIDPEKFKQLMQLKPKLEWVASYFDVSDETIHHYCKNNFGQSFSEFRNKMLMPIRGRLIMTAIDRADKGNTALHIFALKNLCGWSDQPDPFQDEEQEFEIQFE